MRPEIRVHIYIYIYRDREILLALNLAPQLLLSLTGSTGLIHSLPVSIPSPEYAGSKRLCSASQCLSCPGDPAPHRINDDVFLLQKSYMINNITRVYVYIYIYTYMIGIIFLYVLVPTALFTAEQACRRRFVLLGNDTLFSKHVRLCETTVFSAYVVLMSISGSLTSMPNAKQV